MFGPDRSALLAEQLPATAADHADELARHAEHYRKEISRIETAQAALLAELEETGPDTSDAGKAYRARIRTRHAELHDQRTSCETQLAALQATAPPGQRPRPTG